MARPRSRKRPMARWSSCRRGRPMAEAAEARQALASWAVVELMGHVRLAGRVTEEAMLGTALGRIDIPTGEGPEDFVTQYFGGSSGGDTDVDDEVYDPDEEPF